MLDCHWSSSYCCPMPMTSNQLAGPIGIARELAYPCGRCSKDASRTPWLTPCVVPLVSGCNVPCPRSIHNLHPCHGSIRLHSGVGPPFLRERVNSSYSQWDTSMLVGGGTACSWLHDAANYTNHPAEHPTASSASCSTGCHDATYG